MKTLTKIAATLTTVTVLAVGANAAQPKKIKKVTAIDTETGLIAANGVDVVKANCTVCHSAKFILLQRGDRRTWKEMIVWMQKTQGLWKFDEQTEKTILDYLSANYAPDDKIERRKNLPPSARPLKAQ